MHGIIVLTQTLNYYYNNVLMDIVGVLLMLEAIGSDIWFAIHTTVGLYGYDHRNWSIATAWSFYGVYVLL